LKAAPPNLEKAHAALGRIADAGCRAGDILDGLRGLFSSGVQETHSVSINEIIQDTLNSLQSEFARCDVAVHADLNPRLPNVAGHASRLREVMTNLFVNATEAMSSVARQNRVLCVGTKSDDSETISVTIDDSGPGIHADKLASIFNAFVTTKRHGMGLGLAICRTIIEQHGGVLTAGSNSKGGARFQVVLPVVPTTPEFSS